MSPTDGYEVWMTFQGFELWPQSKSPRHSMLSSQHMFPSLFVFIFLTEYVSTTISFLHLPWQLWLGRMWRCFVYVCSAASYATYLSQLLRCLAAVAFSWRQRVQFRLRKTRHCRQTELANSHTKRTLIQIQGPLSPWRWERRYPQSPRNLSATSPSLALEPSIRGGKLKHK